VTTANKYEDKPVVFIAVNSGNTTKEVGSYLKSVSVEWPAIADNDRSFERAIGVPPLSLSNVIQVRIVTPSGKITIGSFSDVEGSFKPYLPMAKWQVDPESITPVLKPAWQHVEFGRTAQTIPLIKRYLHARDEKTKASATTLHNTIEAQLNQRFSQVQEAEAAGNKWLAYKGYGAIATNFKGLAKASEASSKARLLSRDTELKDELRAASALNKAKQQIASRNRQVRRAGTDTLSAIAKRYPDTEAGKTAKSMLK
jgi:hypothetical protein